MVTANGLNPNSFLRTDFTCFCFFFVSVFFICLLPLCSVFSSEVTLMEGYDDFLTILVCVSESCYAENVSFKISDPSVSLSFSLSHNSKASLILECGDIWCVVIFFVNLGFLRSTADNNQYSTYLNSPLLMVSFLWNTKKGQVMIWTDDPTPISIDSINGNWGQSNQRAF
mgnify:FL=1